MIPILLKTAITLGVILVIGFCELVYNKRKLIQDARDHLVFFNPTLTKDGRLAIAVDNSNISRAKALLMNGVNPNFQGLGSDTPLMHACNSRNTQSYEMAKLLLEYNADPNLKDEAKYTALMYACQSSSIEIVRLLLDYGANKGDVNEKGQTALDIAKQRKRKDVSALLEQN